MAHNAHGSSMTFILFTKTVKVLKCSLTKTPPHPHYLILPQKTMINTWLPSKQGHFRCDLCSANYAPRSPFHWPNRDLEVSTISQTLEETGWKMKLRGRVCVIVEAHPQCPPRATFASRCGWCMGGEGGKEKHLPITWKDSSSFANSTTHPSWPTWHFA